MNISRLNKKKSVFFSADSLFVLKISLSNMNITYIIYRRVFQKGLSLTDKESEKQDNFPLFFSIVFFDINLVGPIMLNYLTPISDESGIPVP